MKKEKEWVRVVIGIFMRDEKHRVMDYTEAIAVPDDPDQREQAWIELGPVVRETLGPLIRRTIERAATGKIKEGRPEDIHLDLRVWRALIHYEKERIIPTGEEFAQRAGFSDLRKLNEFLSRRKDWSWKDLRNRLAQAIGAGP